MRWKWKLLRMPKYFFSIWRECANHEEVYFGVPVKILCKRKNGMSNDKPKIASLPNGPYYLLNDTIPQIVPNICNPMETRVRLLPGWHCVGVADRKTSRFVMARMGKMVLWMKSWQMTLPTNVINMLARKSRSTTIVVSALISAIVPMVSILFSN